jgi:hypothetical protein
LPAEEDVLGLEEDVLGLHFTDFPLGLLTSDCAGVTSPCAVADLDLFEDAWTDEIRAQLPVPASLQDSLIHIVGRPRVCGIFGDNTRVCAFTPTDVTPPCGLLDSGANLCMTNNPDLLVDVCPCPPFTISLATTYGGHSHMNVCQRRGLLPLPLLDGTTYYQMCFINPHALETFILPQAIINSITGALNKWQMEGFSQGHPGHLLLFSPSGLLKMSIQLSQQDGLYYSTTDTFTVDTNPHSRYSPFVGSALTDLPLDLHLINDNDSSDCSKESNEDISCNDPALDQVPDCLVEYDEDFPLNGPVLELIPPFSPPCVPVGPSHSRLPALPPTIPRSWVSVHPTNLAHQLESKLWAACLGHCGTNQLIALATRADGLPNGFEFHPFRYIDWKEQA